jgi:aryl-alcohol dehydrogenase-like predicted oxidoreductase
MAHAITPEPFDLGTAVFGTMTFGTQTSEEESRRMVQMCRDAGVKMFDTANMYGEGLSEEILGRAVAPFRDEILIATKVGNRHDLSDDLPQLTPDHIRDEVELSLRRLGTDHIDLYYMHMPDQVTPIEETLGAFQELVDAGKIRAVGHSNYAAWQVMEMIHLAEREGWTRVTYGQPMYNLVARRMEEEYAAFSTRYGVGNIVFNPLAGGLLTGKHALDKAPEPGTRFDTRASYTKRYWTPMHFTAVDRLKEIAADAGMSLIELSLRWLDAQPHVEAVLLGASKVEHLEANLAALQGPPPDAETLVRVDAVWADLRGAAPRYNR